MTPTVFLDGRVRLYAGDNRDALAAMPDCSVDSCVTDPPYALVSIVKRFGKDGAAPAKSNGASGVYKRASSGFMGKQWDTGDVAFDADFWREVYRVLKPGAHVISFGGTRTYHRMASAVEDAGFEIRDQIGWAFGSGFPKSHNAGDGWGTALKPAWEPVVLARKPLIGTVAANVAEYGTGAINVDGCRVDAGERPHIERRNDKSLDGDVYGSGINGSRSLGTFSQGRWPANIVHDGSEDVLAAFPDAPGQQRQTLGTEPSDTTKDIYGKFRRVAVAPPRNDEGSAARFFYQAKADSDDRIGSKHPTVKPVDLMRWLVRLVTPKGGTVLDPFAGTGTTAEAAYYEGFSAILCEREAEYIADIERRMRLVLAGPDERQRETIKARGKTEHPGPLFGDAVT